MLSMTWMRSRHRMSSVILLGGPVWPVPRRSHTEQEMIMSLTGKRVVILGGTSGIGLATAQAAQREGAAVVVASSRKPRVESALSALQGKAQGEVADLADETQVRALFERLGDFDHLVFCAGETLHLETLDRMEIDAARGFMNLRFWGALMAVKYASPHIRPGGSITLTNGIAALRPQQGWTVA